MKSDLLLILAFSVCSLSAFAVPPKTMGNGDCMATSDFYIVHFNAFQPEAAKDKADNAREQRHKKFQPFCRELPHTGRTYFGIDFIDRDVRTMPVAMQVVEEKSGGGEIPEIVRTVLKTPARIYAKWVAELAVDFDRPGKYALLIQFGQDAAFADEVLRIPLEVGRDKIHIPVLAYAAVGAGGIFFALCWFFLLMAFRGGKIPVERKA